MKRKSNAGRKKTTPKVLKVNNAYSFKDRLREIHEESSEEEQIKTRSKSKQSKSKTPTRSSRSKRRQSIIDFEFPDKSETKNKSKSKSNSKRKFKLDKKVENDKDNDIDSEKDNNIDIDNDNETTENKEKKERKERKERKEKKENTQFNSHLHNIIQSFSRENNIKKVTTSKDLSSQFEKFDRFPYDNSIHKQIDIEITIEPINTNTKSNNKSNSKTTKEVLSKYTKKIVDMLNTFFKNFPFIYYEFSNPRGKMNQINSALDNLNYDYLYEKNNQNLNSTENNIRTSSLIKEINYVSAFSSVYKRFIRGELLDEHFEDYRESHPDNFFYLVTPLLSFYFFKYEKSDFFTSTIDEINDSGALISNTNRVLEKNLKDHGIKYQKIDYSRSNTNSKNKYVSQKTITLDSIPYNTSETEVMSNFINNSDLLNTYNSESLIYVKNYYYSLLFNMVISEYEDSSINIFAPYGFDSSSHHNCKIQIEPFIKSESNSIVINIKILGCVFDVNLMRIIKYLTETGTTEFGNTMKDTIDEECPQMKSSFSMKFYPFMKTSNFYSINKKLKGSVEKANYKDKQFSIKMHNY